MGLVTRGPPRHREFTVGAAHLPAIGQLDAVGFWSGDVMISSTTMRRSPTCGAARRARTASSTTSASTSLPAGCCRRPAPTPGAPSASVSVEGRGRGTPRHVLLLQQPAGLPRVAAVVPVRHCRAGPAAHPVVLGRQDSHATPSPSESSSCGSPSVTVTGPFTSSQSRSGGNDGTQGEYPGAHCRPWDRSPDCLGRRVAPGFASGLSDPPQVRHSPRFFRRANRCAFW